MNENNIVPIQFDTAAQSTMTPLTTHIDGLNQSGIAFTNEKLPEFKNPEVVNYARAARFDVDAQLNGGKNNAKENIIASMFPNMGKIDISTTVDVRDTHEKLSNGTTWIPKYKTYIPGTDNDARLSAQQTNLEKVLNPIKRLALNTSKAPLDIIGSVYGIGAAALSGRFDAIYDNDYMHWLDDATTRTNAENKNYYNETERNQNLGLNLQTIDKVLGGAEFTTRLLVAEGLLAVATGGASLPASFAKTGLNVGSKVSSIVGQGNKVSKALKYIKIPEMAAATRAETTASRSATYLKNATSVERGIVDNTKKALESAANRGTMGDFLVKTRFAVTSPLYEAGFESRHFQKEAEDNFWNYYRDKGVEPTAEEINDFSDKLSGAANGVFMANMAILGPSNLAMMGNVLNLSNPFSRAITSSSAGVSERLFGMGVSRSASGTFSALKPTLRQKTAAYISPLLKSAVTEGVYEEGGQGIASSTFKNYVASAYNPEYSKTTANYIDSFGKAFSDQFGTKEGREEMIIGGIIGALFGGFGAVRGSNSVANQYKKQERIAEVYNTGLNFAENFRSNAYTNEWMLSLFSQNNRFQDIQEQLNNASKSGDKLAQASLQAQSFVSLLDAYHSVGKEDSFMNTMSNVIQGLDSNMIAESTGLSMEEIAEYKNEQIQNMQDMSKSYGTSLKAGRYLFGQNVSGMTEADVNGKKVKVNGEMMANALAFSTTMASFNEKFAGESYNALQLKLAETAGGRELVEKMGSVMALKSLGQVELDQYRNLNSEISKYKDEITKITDKIAKLDQGEQRENSTAIRVELAKQLEVAQSNLVGVSEKSDALFKAGVESFYAKVGTTGYGHKIELDDFSTKVAELNDSLANLKLSPSDKVIVDKLFEQFNKSNDAHRSFVNMAENIQDSKFTPKVFNAMFGGMRAKWYEKSVNEHTLDTLAEIFEFKKESSRAAFETTQAFSNNPITEEQLTDDYTPVIEDFKEIQKRLNSKKELNENEQAFYTKYKELIDSYINEKEEDPLNDESESTVIDELYLEKASKEKELEDLLNGEYSDEIQSKIDKIESEISEIESSTVGTNDTVTNTPKNWLDRIVDQALINFTNNKQSKGPVSKMILDLFETYRSNPTASIFNNILTQYYLAIRSGKYDMSKTDLDIADYTLKTNSSIVEVRNESGWHYRLSQKNIGKSKTRISLNVEGNKELIDILDKIALDYGVYYKTPSLNADWGERHDPVTLYISNSSLTEDQIQELKDRVVKETAPYIRSNEGFGMYGENISEGVEFGDEATSENAQDLINEARLIDEELAKGIEIYLEKNGVYKGSVGQQMAVRQLLNDILNSNTDTSNTEIESLNQEIQKLEKEIQDLEISIEEFENRKTRTVNANKNDYQQYSYVKANGDTVIGYLEVNKGILQLINEDEIVDIRENPSSLRNTDLSDIKGLEQIKEEDIIIEGKEIYVNGKIYKLGLKNPTLDGSISKDKNGNYQVTLQARNGRMVTLKGSIADAIVYQNLLNKLEQNATDEQIRELGEQAKRDSEIEGKYEELVSKTEDRDSRIDDIEREIEEAKIEQDRLNAETESKIEALENQIDDLLIDEEIKLQNELDAMNGVITLQEKIDSLKEQATQLREDIIDAQDESEPTLQSDFLGKKLTKLELEITTLERSKLEQPFNSNATPSEQLEWVVNNISDLNFENIEEASNFTKPSQEDIDEYLALIDTKNRNSVQKKRIAELREKLTPFIIAEGLSLDGMNILDMIDLHNQSKKIKDIQETQNPGMNEKELKETVKRVDDNTNLKNEYGSENVGIVYDGTYVKKRNNKYSIFHIKLETMLRGSLENGHNPVISVYETDSNGKKKLINEITVTSENLEQMDSMFDNMRNIKVTLSDGMSLTKAVDETSFSLNGALSEFGDMLGLRGYAITGQPTDYILFYEQKSDGTWGPKESEFSVRNNDVELPFNKEILNSIKAGDTVTLEFDPMDSYNMTLPKNRYEAEGNIYVRKNGELVQILKASNSVKSNKNGKITELEALRKTVVKNPNKVMQINVVNSYLGLPIISIDAQGNAIQVPLDESKVLGYGYVDETGQIRGDISKLKIDNIQYVAPLSKLSKKTPIVAFESNGQVIVFPINLRPKGVDVSAEVDTIMSNSDTNRQRKMFEINTLLEKHGLFDQQNAVTDISFDINSVKESLSQVYDNIDVTDINAVKESDKFAYVDLNDAFKSAKLVFDYGSNIDIAIKDVGKVTTEIVRTKVKSSNNVGIDTAINNSCAK